MISVPANELRSPGHRSDRAIQNKQQQILLRDRSTRQLEALRIADHAGNKHLDRNFNTETPERFLIALQPFEEHDLIIGLQFHLQLV